MNKNTCVFIAILLIALSVRLFGLNWDQNHHLHPDERFLTMVGTSIEIPESFSEYMDPVRSSFSPYNNNYPFFVYGSFPLYLNKFVAMVFEMDSYDGITISGRFLSAVFDTATVALVFLLSVHLSDRLSKKKSSRKSYAVGYFASLLYALNVFAIQQAHFFTVDSALVFFMTLTMLLLLKGLESNNKGALYYIFAASMSLAFAAASKVIALVLLPILLFAIFIHPQRSSIFSIRIIGLCLACVIGVYVVFRLIQPFYFANSHFLDARLNPQTIENFRQLKALDNEDTTFPPAVQWLSKPSVVWPLMQMFFIGLNPVVFLIVVGGMMMSLAKIKNFRNRRGLILVFVFIVGFFAYQSTQFTMNMRYFYPLYPLFMFFGAVFLIDGVKKGRWRFGMQVLVIGVSAAWCFSFLSIYSRPHTRIAASEWIYSHIPQGSVIAYEHWDDPLPLALPQGQSSMYTFVELPVFDQDSQSKWNTFQERLTTAHYYILSSNRGWGSIPDAQMRYPQTTRFYEKLFSNQLGLTPVAQFTSRPQLGSLELNDDHAEESFTVYDHPVVYIFEVSDRAKLNTEIRNLSR